MNYGFLDGGFYTACEIYPEFKFFCRLNIDLPEMYAAQDEYISKKFRSLLLQEIWSLFSPDIGVSLRRAITMKEGYMTIICTGGSDEGSRYNAIA